MKTAIAIAMLLTAAFVSPSNAGSGIKIERPCGNRCSAPQPAPQPHPTDFYGNCCAVGTVAFREMKQPNYESVSRMVIRSSYGTSVVDSSYRSYR